MSLVSLVSNEGTTFQLSADAAKVSRVLATMLEEDNDTQEAIPVPNANDAMLSLVVQFLEHYQVEPLQPIAKPLKWDTHEQCFKPEWYATFIQREETELRELLMVANFLDIAPLLDLSAGAYAIYLKDRPVAEVCRLLNIPLPVQSE
jgi:hypothetical protein